MSSGAYQKGSTVGFILVAVALAVGLVGSVYFLNQRGKQVSIQTADDTSRNKQAASPKPVPVTKPTTNVSSAASTVTKDTGDASTGDVNLPVTGSENGFIEMAGVYFLTFCLTEYILSRKKLTRTL